METLSVNPRASEQVRNYLEKEFLVSGKKAGCRLPAVESLAGHLEVSVSTVRAVIRKLAHEGYLETQAGLGTFVKKAEKGGNHPLLIASNILTLDRSRLPNWTESIYLAVMRAASTVPNGISLMPVVPHKDDEGELLHAELINKIDNVDMVMLFASPNRDKVHTAYEAAGKPVVDINPQFLNATANFVSTDFYGAGRKIGEAWHATGRRRILYITTLPLSGSTSAELSYAGLAAGVRVHSDPAVEICAVSVVGAAESDGAQAIMETLQIRKFIPDAVFCLGDYLGIGALNALKDAGFDVPTQVSLVAGTGLPSTLLMRPDLSLMAQPFEEIGANAVQMLCHRHRNRCVAVPGIYLPAAIHKGSTTRPEENALL